MKKIKNVLKATVAIMLVGMVVVSVGIPKISAKTIQTKIGITINNEIKVIPKEMGEPFSMDSRTFVPLRFVSENLGFKVDWEQKTQTATVHGHNGPINVTIGSKDIGSIKMDVAPFIKDGRTYVPVRFVAEALGFEVDWVPATKITGSRNHAYSYYVTIDGLLGNSVGSTGSGVSNIVSDNPKDWPETENEYQKDYVLAKNKELINFMEENYNGRYHIAGYSISGMFQQKLDATFAISKNVGGQLSSNTALYAVDLRDVHGYWIITINTYSVVKEGFEQMLYGIAGQEDGKYIFDYVERGMTEALTANEWVKTPSGREFQIVWEKGRHGVELLIK